MPVTQADIDTLNQAIADGVRQVTLPGGQVTIFQTTESLIKARDDAKTELNKQNEIASGKPKRRRTMLYYAGRGYQS